MVHKYADADAKRSRQEAILEIILREPIATQGQLVKALKEAGISATQASVSRDIAELGLLKAHGRYQAAPSPAAAPNDPEMPLRAYVQTALPAGPHLVVLRTNTGTAQQVGLALDRLRRAGVVGTIAGDDTVFVAVDSKSASHDLINFLGLLIAKREVLGGLA